MPNPAAAELIATNLAQLPHPDGTPLMFPNHSGAWPGLPEDMQAQITAMNTAIAEAFVNLLETNGYAIASQTELQTAQQLGTGTLIALHCQICGNIIIEILAGRDGKASIPPRAINPECEARHGAA